MEAVLKHMTKSNVKRILIILIIIITFSFILIFYHEPQKFWEKEKLTFLNSVPPQPTPLVLIWTSHYEKKWEDAGRMFEKCPSDLKCRTTFDRDRLNESAAVVFFIRDLNWIDIPPIREPNQYYIFSLFESPYHTEQDISSTVDKRGFFNLTLTYRSDSDQVWPYASFRKKRMKYENTSNIAVMPDDFVMEIVKKKSKLLAWFVSHCETNSGREKFVQQLKEYVSVDIYGSCGNLTCPKESAGWETGIHDAGECNRILTQDYKFYLSLENSLCKDYVTEKLYLNMDNSIIVPIVMERKLLMNTVKDDNIAQIINKSIIAVDDFGNVQQLAEYLKYLDKNITAYMEYLEWRKSVEIIYDDAECCDLCGILKEGKEHRIEDISEWWIDQAKCHSWK